jgi:carboxymethylenebutenolidase
MPELTLTSPLGPMQAYTATPAGPGPWPGVVIIHDAFGMTRALREQADWLAGAGFLAIAPSLFRLPGKLACMRAAMRDVAARSGPMFQDIEAARAWLIAQLGCTGKVGVIGFCMGGGFAMALALDRHYSASSVNYGRLPADAEKVLAGACPIVGSYGGKDRGLRGAPQRLEGILQGHGIAHDVKEYPEAGHGFMENHDPKELPGLFLLLRPLMGAGYNEPSTLDARKRVVSFFNTHLRAA